MKRTLTTHHKANGKVERFIQFLKHTLGTVVNASMKDWNEMVDNVLFVNRKSLSRVLDDGKNERLVCLISIKKKLWETPKKKRMDFMNVIKFISKIF